MSAQAERESPVEEGSQNRALAEFYEHELILNIFRTNPRMVMGYPAATESELISKIEGALYEKLQSGESLESFELRLEENEGIGVEEVEHFVDRLTRNKEDGFARNLTGVSLEDGTKVITTGSLYATVFPDLWIREVSIKRERPAVSSTATVEYSLVGGNFVPSPSYAPTLASRNG